MTPDHIPVLEHARNGRSRTVKFRSVEIDCEVYRMADELRKRGVFLESTVTAGGLMLELTREGDDGELEQLDSAMCSDGECAADIERMVKAAHAALSHEAQRT